MRTYGNLIIGVGGHTQNSPVVVDRMIEVYTTKTKIRIYIFDSTYKYWHKKCHLIDMMEISINGEVKDIVTELINNFATKHGIRMLNK